MMFLEKYILNSPYYLRELSINIYGYYLSKQRFNKRFFKLFEGLMSNLNKSESQIKTEQFELLKRTLIKAYETVPYYSNIFDQINFNPYDFNEIQSLSKLPLLDKEIIRDNFQRLQNRHIPKKDRRLHTTSGSTGEKLKFLQPKHLTFTLNAAYWYRFYALHDVKPKDRRITIGGRRFTNKPPYWSFNRFENQLLLSSHHLNHSNGLEYIKKINEFKPVFLQGHPNSILFLANLINNGFAKSIVPLKAIFTTGETLSEENRVKIELAFKTVVSQQYGSGESCFSAQETPEKVGYMLNYEHGFVELIGDGEYKEVIATSFHNDVMPFIRYRVGDLVRPIVDCKERSNSFPYLFDEVLGRVDDILVTSKGEQILPVSVRMIVKSYLVDNTNYQLVQFSLTEFILNLVDNEKRIDARNLIADLRGLLGHYVGIEIRYVDSLVSAGGKIRNIINRTQK